MKPDPQPQHSDLPPPWNNCMPEPVEQPPATDEIPSAKIAPTPPLITELPATDDKQEWTPEKVLCYCSSAAMCAGRIRAKDLADDINAALAAEREKTRLANIDAANLLAELGDRTTPEMIEYHADHGRGISEPDDSDCPCRGTDKEHDCALVGCGFCKASERDLRQQLAAERERADKLADSVEHATLKWSESNQQLAAEREKNERQVNTFRLLGDALGIINPDEHTDQLFIAIANLKRKLLAAQAAIAEHNRDVENGTLRHSRPISVDLSAIDKHDKEVLKPLVDALERIRSEAVTLVDARKNPNSVLHFESPQRIKAIANDALSQVKLQDKNLDLTET